MGTSSKISQAACQDDTRAEKLSSLASLLFKAQEEREAVAHGFRVPPAVKGHGVVPETEHLTSFGVSERRCMQPDITYSKM